MITEAPQLNQAELNALLGFASDAFQAMLY
jgi:hypothetical protein